MESNKDEAAGHPPSRPETFWSSCNGCGMQYEYLKMYLNQNLLCPNCRLPFLATEKPAPSPGKIHRTPGPWSVLQQQRQGTFAGSGGSGSASFTPSSATPTAQLIQPEGESLQDGMKTAALARSQEALQKNSVTPGKTDFPSASERATKKRRTDGPQRETRKIPSGNLKGKLGAGIVNSAGDKSTSGKELSQSEIRTLLMVRAKTEIREKLNQWGIGAK